MSHDRGCPCGREKGEYESCPDPQCTRRPRSEEEVERLVNERMNEQREEDDREVANIVAMPQRQDEFLKNYMQHMKFLQATAENAAQIARTKRALYLAYVKEGFEPGQAMMLISQGSVI